jgi:hypothetical protein
MLLAIADNVIERGFLLHCMRRLLCRFSDAGNDDLTMRSGGRRSEKQSQSWRLQLVYPRAFGRKRRCKPAQRRTPLSLVQSLLFVLSSLSRGRATLLLARKSALMLRTQCLRICRVQRFAAFFR